MWLTVKFEQIAPKILEAGYTPLLQSHSPWIWTENFFSRHNLLMTDGNNGYDDVNTASIKDPHDYEAALFHGYPSLSSFLFSFVPFAELIRFKHSWKFETIKHALQGQLTY